MRFRPAPAVSLVAAAAGALLVLTGCAPATTDATTGSAAGETSATAGACDGVRLLVEFSELGEDTIDTCVDAEARIGAREVLDAAGVKTEGTLAYGDATVCRVDGRPAADETVSVEGFGDLVETCESFTEGMYWALWQQTGGGEWAYAPVGVNELTLEPGDALGLVFTTGDGSTELPPEA